MKMVNTKTWVAFGIAVGLAIIIKSGGVAVSLEVRIDKPQTDEQRLMADYPSITPYPVDELIELSRQAFSANVEQAIDACASLGEFGAVAESALGALDNTATSYPDKAVRKAARVAIEKIKAAIP